MSKLPTLREKIKELNLAKQISAPDNVVLVTVDDIIELYWQLAPYTMQKLDEAATHQPQNQPAQGQKGDGCG
jgi:hypothetical protein